MSCKVLFFDLTSVEKSYFDKYNSQNFDIVFFKHSLNPKSVNDLAEQDLEKTGIISVSELSNISKDVLDKFKNLRMVSTRSLDYGHIDLVECINRNIAVVNVDPFNNPEFSENILNVVFSCMEDYMCGGKKCRIV